MIDEFSTLQQNDTWDLVPRPPSTMWSRASGFIAISSLLMALFMGTRQGGWFVGLLSALALTIYDETFSLVIQPATLRIVLCVALSH